MENERQYEARKRAARMQREHGYLDGNVVRKPRQVQEPSRQSVRVRTEQERRNYHIQRNRQNASFMTLPYVIILCVASIIVLLVSVQYLEARNNINDGARTITLLEQKLEKMKEANSGQRKSIDHYTDLNYVYQVATEELGMVPAGEDQVIHFDRTESEYVRQNEDIPIQEN